MTVPISKLSVFDMEKPFDFAPEPVEVAPDQIRKPRSWASDASAEDAEKVPASGRQRQPDTGRQRQPKKEANRGDSLSPSPQNTPSSRRGKEEDKLHKSSRSTRRSVSNSPEIPVHSDRRRRDSSPRREDSRTVERTHGKKDKRGSRRESPRRNGRDTDRSGGGRHARDSREGGFRNHTQERDRNRRSKNGRPSISSKNGGKRHSTKRLEAALLDAIAKENANSDVRDSMEEDSSSTSSQSRSSSPRGRRSSRKQRGSRSSNGKAPDDKRGAPAEVEEKKDLPLDRIDFSKWSGKLWYFRYTKPEEVSYRKTMRLADYFVFAYLAFLGCVYFGRPLFRFGPTVALYMPYWSYIMVYVTLNVIYYFRRHEILNSAIRIIGNQLIAKAILYFIKTLHKATDPGICEEDLDYIYESKIYKFGVREDGELYQTEEYHFTCNPFEYLFGVWVVRTYMACAFAFIIIKAIQKASGEYICYEVLEILDDPVLDGRPDLVAVSKLKHMEVGYARMRVTKTYRTDILSYLPEPVIVLLTAIFDPNNGWRFMSLDFERGLYCSKRITVSLQLVTQLATSGVVSLNTTEKTMWLRINQTLKALHSVNEDRSKVLDNVFVRLETSVFCYHMFMDKVRRLRPLDFPLPVEI